MGEKSEWKESLSFEETNKIRISLGLKPLSADAPPKTEDAVAEDNYQRRRAEERAEQEQQALKARIDKARNAKERVKKLVGAGLGDAGPERADKPADDADTKAWVRRQKKRAKELAEKRAKELEEQERLAEQQGLPKYGEEDLAGIKVAHGQDDFDEGEETILTLKDSRILDDEGECTYDELHNINLSEQKMAAEAVELKKKGRQAGQYTGYDDDEFDPANIGSQRSVLKKYDEEIMGKPEEGFRLGASAPSAGPSRGQAGGSAQGADAGAERERVKLSMDYAKTFNTDYLQEGEAGFKIKKKKKRATRTKDAQDEAADPTAMDVDGAGPRQVAIERQNLDATNLVDDDDLQASLARQRREANKKKIAEIKARAAAALIERERQDSMDLDGGFVKREPDDENGQNGAGDEGDVLVLDDTSEFVRNIQLAAARPPVPRTNGVVVKKEEGTDSIVPQIKREEEDVPLDELTTTNAHDNSAMDEDDQEEEGLVHDEEDVKPKTENGPELGTAGEVLVSGGMASTLSLLRNQGLIKPRTPEEIERERVLKEREAWLAKQRRRDEQREAERIASRQAGSSKDQQQREYENRMRDQREAQEALDSFKDYKPTVNLEYRDEFGRQLSAKEAWKQMTHQFHGKTSGSKKTEKRLAKIEAEQKALAMASGDTPLSTAAAFQARAERTGSATMVLSVGNKGSAPIPDAHLENLSKSNGDKNAKGKGKGPVRNGREHSASAAASGPASTTVFNDIPMRPIPLGSPGAARGDSPAAEASPAPARRAGFRPVGFAPIGQSSNGAGPGSASPASRADSPASGVAGESRLEIPLQVKRKAVGEAMGAPERKR
ncbi:hypothetical protein OIO90_004048 [Microbotryomycetes sp. JL221]|nr:hypothetical protein OIO90_004048 [Microbotryomycetes sp. JL221]